MIPYRAPAAPPRTESIPDRLARLRSEQRSASSSADRRCAPGTRSSSSWSASAMALANSFGADWDTRAARARGRNANRTTLAAGPPAPPSWGPQVGRGSAGPLGSSQSGPSSSRTAKATPLELSRREAIVAAQLRRDQILQPLFPSTHFSLVPGPPPVPSLLLTCAHLIIAVLVDPPQRHLVLPFLPILPDHLRLNLFDWTTTSGYALEERAIYQLLLPYDDNGEEEEEESVGYNDSSTSSDGWDYSDSDKDPLPGGYLTPFRRSLSSSRFPYQSLTSLNLAFSPLKLPFLRSLLLSPRSIPLFPHLSHLNLAATPNLYFIEAFFKLLSSLISLRSLSLAGKSLYPPLHLGEEEEDEEEDAVTPAHIDGFFNRPASTPRFLPRLVEATPTLQSLDLSYIPDLNINTLHGIAWDRQWLDLVKLGVKTYPARTTSIELERGRRLNELGFVVKRRGEKTRKRLWLDVYY